mmetsp:Transcript_58884/g.141252  ORF Transcript_58884/g.141252 Transcript_58884/m.141252 type:complete len:287 (+) Transcript_58884:585-1445(+)
MYHAVRAQGERGRVLPQALVEAVPCRLDADQLDGRVIEESGEEPERVAAAAHASEQHVGRGTSRDLGELLLGLEADDALEVAHHHREGVGADGRADGEEHRLVVAHEGAEGRVHRLLERLTTFSHRDDSRTEHLHATHVRPLLLDVDLAHVDLALELHECGGGGERDAVLARARLGNDLALPHALCKECLAEAVVDLVGARVVKVLALEIDLCASMLVGEVLAVEDRRRAPDELLAQPSELREERRVLLDLHVCIEHSLHDRLKRRRQVRAAVLLVLSKVSIRCRQ